MGYIVATAAVYNMPADPDTSVFNSTAEEEIGLIFNGPGRCRIHFQ